MIDVVYILGKESRWHDAEIKYSVRSVEKYLQNYRNIIIIGEKPAFFNNEIIHIPAKDEFGNKATNIMTKILKAANHRGITKQFMLFNDDYFLLKPTDATTYPHYYKNTLPQALEKNRSNHEFYSHLNATIKALEGQSLPLKNFDSHYPILYDKHKVRMVVDMYEWAIPFGYVFKSLYCNTVGIEGIMLEDCKINHPHILSNWPNLTKGRHMFSIGDRCVNKSMEQYLTNLYPDKSKYET